MSTPSLAPVIPFQPDFVIQEDPAERAMFAISCAVGDLIHQIDRADNLRRVAQLDQLLGHAEALIAGIHDTVARKRNAL